MTYLVQLLTVYLEHRRAVTNVIEEYIQNRGGVIRNARKGTLRRFYTCIIWRKHGDAASGS